MSHFCPDPNSICCPDYASVYQPCCFNTSLPILLPTFSERRGRLSAAGSFFRSVFSGSLGNQVNITIDWLDSIGDVTTNQFDMTDVRVTVDGTNENGSTFSQIYTVAQSVFGSPEIWVNGIDAMRTAINNDPLNIVSMPLIDIESGFNKDSGSPFSGTGSPPNTDHPDRLDMLSITSLSGATGPPIDTPSLDVINTSDAITICYIDNAEHTNLITPQNAKLNDANPTSNVFNVSVKEWTGTTWRIYAPTC